MIHNFVFFVVSVMSKPEVIVQRIEQERFKKSKLRDWKLSHYLNLKSFPGYTVP